MDMYKGISGNVMVVRKGAAYGVIDNEGNEIVPFGKYDWIDQFEYGLARVNKKGLTYRVGDNSLRKFEALWGIINERGEEVLPVEYDAIWNFVGKNRNSTKIVKDGCSKLFYFDDTDNADSVESEYVADRVYDYDDRHYDDFAGTYAQDVAGYSDEDIYDAFEGDPEAYWNID